MNQSEHIYADALVGIARNINFDLYQYMHAFQVQQLQSLPGTQQCKSLQLQASRVTIATGNKAARDLFVYTKTVVKQAMTTKQLRIYTCMLPQI